VDLYARRNGEGENALIILPGLLGSSVNWQSIAKRLGQNRSVYTLDMRNHGQSPWSDIMDYDSMADDVAEFIESLDHPRINLLGHSMGGKVAMRLALSKPEYIDSLIIADIAPVAYEHDFNELIEPMLALDLSSFKSRAEADAALQVSVADAPIRAFLLHNLTFDKPGGVYIWRPNLAALLENMSAITGFPVYDIEIFEKPSLFIYGANSKYVTPVSQETIVQYFPQTSFTELENAGHWLHAEQPKAFIKACEAFLSHDN
jgi:pimeloyl-ACP methyl ester carboxylesterase